MDFNQLIAIVIWGCLLAIPAVGYFAASRDAERWDQRNRQARSDLG